MVPQKLKKFLSPFRLTIAVLLVSIAAYAAFIPNSLQVANNITLGGTVDGRDIDTDGSTLDNLDTTLGLGSFTAAEVTQLQTIDSVTIDNTQWGFLGASDQAIAVGSNVSFAEIEGTEPLLLNHESTPSNPAASKNKLYFKSDDELYMLNNGGSEEQISGAAAAFPTFLVDVNIGGANVSLGSSAVTTYGTLSDAGLDMVDNNSSDTVEIPCGISQASSGLTCGGGASEHVGVVFIIATTGLYKACFEFGHFMDLNASGIVNVTFQVTQTGNASTTTTAEGNGRISSRNSGAADITTSNNVCGVFSFGTTGEKTLRLKREQSVTATVTTNTVLADRGASNGQRDIHIIVWKIADL